MKQLGKRFHSEEEVKRGTCFYKNHTSLPMLSQTNTNNLAQGIAILVCESK